MAEFLIKMKRAARPLLGALILLLAFGTVAIPQEHHFSEDAWSFGVIGDTQWTLGMPGFPWDPDYFVDDPEGTNPNFVSLSVARQINQKFIEHGVKFVIQMGDLTNWAGDAAIGSWAQEAQNLYNAGIGFFPMRGNHETYGSFFEPWGFVDLDPLDAYMVPEMQNHFPQTRGLSNTFGATNFDSPTDVAPELDGISYSFDYGPSGGNARFVIVDPWATGNAFEMINFVYYGYPIGEQQGWISSRLDKTTRGTAHAFVLSHQPLLGQNHLDTPFGGLPGDKLDDQQAFYDSLDENDVGFYIGAHDHMHHRSVLTSPDGNSKVTAIITQPASSKFYTPEDLENEDWAGQKDRELSLSQELYNIGYYIYTIDGPRVTVDYYADGDDNFLSDSGYPNEANPAFVSKITPRINFVKKETWGYSLNGQEFLVMEDALYAGITDAYNSTTMEILSGLNNSSDRDHNERQLAKAVNTGWTAGLHMGLLSDILSLWGMEEMGSGGMTDIYTLSMTYQGDLAGPFLANSGIATRDSSGKWVNAVNMNFGGAKSFVNGPWRTGYPLGTYGIDTATNTAWAVINYNADFAVVGYVLK
jgi:hypothetical protein